MASLESEIPVELLNPGRKMDLIEWIRAKGLPSRIARKLLQDWGAAVNVELNSTDYELVGTVGHT